jgi:hypothetical protein
LKSCNQLGLGVVEQLKLFLVLSAAALRLKNKPFLSVWHKTSALVANYPYGVIRAGHTEAIQLVGELGKS